MSAPAKLRPATAPVVLTANGLADGRVAWLAAGGHWTPRIVEARVFAPGAAEEALALGQAAEKARLVVGAYTVEVELGGGIPVPRRFRERLRVTGPSVDAEPHPALSLAS
ncbi:DUF2849 domain-containing protein [Falsiroseomonas sp. HW251]|uniref:DUF2849 domain-containing protein n=1 Tax=Falsiroseomonas sp. HW251 TaxID=3390998 RepID=UPI003D31916D